MSAVISLDRRRIVVYALFCLAPLGLMFCVVPDYIILSRRAIDQGELPLIGVWAVAFVRFSLAFSYVPAAAAFVFAVGAAEVIRFALGGRGRLTELVWGAVVILISAFTLLLALSPFIYPIIGKGNFRPKSQVVRPWIVGQSFVASDWRHH
jgi:hypothetical protein